MVLKPVQRHCFKTILQSQDVQTGDCKTESRGIWMQVRGRNIVKEKLKKLENAEIEKTVGKY